VKQAVQQKSERYVSSGCVLLNRVIAMSGTSSRRLSLFHGDLGNVWEKLAKWSSLIMCKESRMDSPDIAETAFARAWSVYLLIHSGIDENDARRSSLQRFIRQRCKEGETDAELLAVEGLKFLKGLEGLPEED
jgi:hypothetical protein